MTRSQCDAIHRKIQKIIPGKQFILILSHKFKIGSNLSVIFGCDRIGEAALALESSQNSFNRHAVDTLLKRIAKLKRNLSRN